jgi:hypothetical protein
MMICCARAYDSYDLSAATSAISGHAMDKPVKVELLDSYGQRVRSDSKSAILAELVDGSNATLVSPLAICKAGLATFTELAIFAAPGASTRLQLTATSLVINAINADVALGECPPGMAEEETARGNIVCTPCEKPFFELKGVCVDCPRGLGCDAAASGVPLSQLAVLKGYWRRSESSFDLYKCPLDDACVGTAPAEARRRLDDAADLCGPGYDGVLCSVCESGFVLNLGRCEECASMSYTSLAICAVVAVFFVSTMVCLSRSRRFAAAMESVSVGVEIKVRTATCELHTRHLNVLSCS